MPGFDPFTLALGGLSAIPSVIAGFQQRNAANNLKLQDTTTAAEREQLAMSRQAAATGRMPGQGAAENRLGMIQAGAVQNARLGAASSSDFLASAGAADARRMQGEQQLATQGMQYQDRSKMQLRQDLTTQSQRQQRDLDTYNQQKAALLQGSATNLNNAVQTGVAYGAQAYNMGNPKTPNATGAAAAGYGAGVGLGSESYANPAFGPYGGVGNMGYGRRLPRYNMGINFGGRPE
jgi:hypothetical protein